MNVEKLIEMVGQEDKPGHVGFLRVNFRPPGGHAYVTGVFYDEYVGLILQCEAKRLTSAQYVLFVARSFVQVHEDNARYPALIQMGDGRMYHLLPSLTASSSMGRSHELTGLPIQPPRTIMDLYPVE